MAVTRVTTIQAFTGLAADTKPTTDVPVESRYHERDTGRKYMWGGTVWHQDQEGNQELGLTELIGIDEAVASTNYGGSVGVALVASTSGTIKSVQFVSKETGTGAVQTPAGTLYIYDADPEISANDAAMSAAAADHAKLIGRVQVLTGDWQADTSGAEAYIITSIPFHSVATLYFSWRMASGSAVNDAAGDDESLLFNAWYQCG